MKRAGSNSRPALRRPADHVFEALTRRTVIVGLGVVLVGRAARAHAQARRLPRIGVLSATPPPPDPAGATAKEALKRGLRELDWNPGVDIAIEYRYASGSVERMREQVAELIRLSVDVIVARGTQATQLAREATSTVPIVMSFVADSEALPTIAEAYRSALAERPVSAAVPSSMREAPSSSNLW